MSQSSFQGTERPSSSSSDPTALLFFINSLLTGVRTQQLVKVVSCTNTGDASPIGTVVIQPLVSMVDGQGNVAPHDKVYSVPYLRVQGGTNAVILDPQAGDIGIAAFCDRDISAVKATQGAAAPASARKFDFSDAVYLMTVLSKTAPTNYVAFTEGGIQVISPSQITIQAPNSVSNGAWQHTGSIMVSDDVIASGVSMVNHLHGGVVAGGSETLPPIP